MSKFAPQYGFLFEEESSYFPGIGELIEVLRDGQELAKQREALGLTQQEVADQAKINIRQYQRLESGERSIFSSSFRIGLSVCHVLKIDPMFYCPVAPKKSIHKAVRSDIDVPSANTSPCNKKFVLFNTNEDEVPQDIIAVEYGIDIDAVYDRLSRDIKEDLTECEKYYGCAVDVYQYAALTPTCYTIDAVVIPPHAPSNILFKYQVQESESG